LSFDGTLKAAQRDPRPWERVRRDHGLTNGRHGILLSGAHQPVTLRPLAVIDQLPTFDLVGVVFLHGFEQLLEVARRPAVCGHCFLAGLRLGLQAKDCLHVLGQRLAAVVALARRRRQLGAAEDPDRTPRGRAFC
jgi:hypothetical protein